MGNSLVSRISAKFKKEVEEMPKPQPLNLEEHAIKHNDNLTADHFFELRTYLAKKEKVAATQEANRIAAKMKEEGNNDLNTEAEKAENQGSSKPEKSLFR